MRATFLSFAMAAALAFAGSGDVFAQHHGGHYGGGHYGGGHYGGGHAGYYHGGHYGGYWGGHHGYWGGYGRLGWGAGYLGWGGYWPSSYGYGYGYGYSPGYYDYGYAYPSYSYYDVTPAVVDVTPPVVYTTPSTTVVTPAASAQAVTMTVMVPDANAEVFLNNQPTTSSGTERVFQSPPLDPGKSYEYTVTARFMQDGRMVEQKRAVPVQAGQSVVVDFRTPATETSVPPTYNY